MTHKQRTILIWTLSVLVVFLGLFLALCLRPVPTGHTGIVATFGNISDTTLDAGAHIKSPFQRIISIDNREQHHGISTLAFSKDTQEVAVSYSVNYQVNRESVISLYKGVGTRYYEVLIYPRLQEAVKGVIKQYTADELIKNRDELSPQIKGRVVDDIGKYGITILSVYVVDIDFSDSYTNAVEAKQVAEQMRLKAIIEQEQLTNEAKKLAEREVIKAEAELTKEQRKADAEAYAITKKADAEAAANIKIAESITPELTQYMEIQRWDGRRVIEINGGTVPLLNIGDGVSGE